MGENRERRQAHRQRRGLLRVEEILGVAGTLFAEVGYDKTTTNMIAARAEMSPGSLYQFFQNKEAITLAFATSTTEHLHQVYDSLLASSVLALPLAAFIDELIDGLIDFNRSNPGYLALELSSTVSPSLALALKNLHHGVFVHLDSIFAAYWPESTAEERDLPLLISYRLFYALLPAILHSDEHRRQAIVSELKTCLYRYWEPIMIIRK